MATRAARYAQSFFGDEGSGLIGLPGASILIREAGTVSAAPLWANRTKTTALVNPLPTGVPYGSPGLDVDGNAVFYADPGDEDGSTVYEAMVTVGNTTVGPIPIGTIPPDMADVQAPIPSGTLVQVAGDTMTGPLVLAADATAALQAVPKQQLDASLADASVLFSKLKRGVNDANMVVLGDSTGDENSEWVYLSAVALAARYPAYTVRYNKWNSTSNTYDAAVTIAAGSGSKFLDIWNASVAGVGTAYFLAPYFETMIASKQPDLAVISLGHNEGTSDPGGITETHWRGQYLALTELVAQACPSAGIVLIAQNPQTANNDQARRATVYEAIASSRGYGFIDVHQAFVDTGTPATYLQGDGIHPNALGEALWRDTVMAAFATAPRGRRRAQAASGFDQVGDQQLVNGGFDDFKVSPAGWVLSGCTVTKDGTKYRSKKEYSARIRATGAAQSFMRKDLSPLQAYVGKWVTVVVWTFVPTGQTGNAGRIALSDGTQSWVTRGPGPSNGWVPQVLTMRVAAGATYVRVTIYGDSGAVSTADINVDSVDVVEGAMPRKAVIPGALPIPANLVAQDTFTRSDSTTTLGSTEAVPGYSALPWTAVSAVSGVTNRKMYRVSGTNHTVIINPALADIAVEDTITAHPTTRYQGITFRYIDASNYLLAVIRNTEVTLYKVEAGAFTALGAYAFTAVVGQDYLLRAQIQGSTVKVLLDEVERISYTLTAGEITTFGAATKVGIVEQSASNGGLHDNFTVYKL